MQLNFKIYMLLALLSCIIPKIHCHGRLRDPPSRSTIWRLSEFKHLNPPKNYNDHGLNCGGFSVQYGVNGGKCAECGDPYNEPIPRPNEAGGKYSRGIIVRKYKAGSEIPIHVELTSNHKGYFEFRLCPHDQPNLAVRQDCLDRYILPLATGYGTGTRYTVQSGITDFNFKVKLPEGVKCSNCVLQWHYRAGNNWGICQSGRGALGCGNQETFRSCSDIKIY